MKASELIMRCLENEDVRYLFGISGGENIELLSAVAPGSKMESVLTRDERGAAFMTGIVGRITGKPDSAPQPMALVRQT